MGNRSRLRGHQDMPETAIDSKEVREHFEDRSVYRLAVVIIAIFKHKGHGPMYCQDYSQILSKKLKAVYYPKRFS